MLGNRFEEVIEAVSRIDKRPVVPALSSPTERAQCTPEQAYTWSKGEAIYAAGVQFPPVHLNGQTFLPGQANNYYIFPAVGLAIFATQASRVTDEMFIEAATGVADQVAPDLLKQGLLYPLLADILETEIQTAARVQARIPQRDCGAESSVTPDAGTPWLSSTVSGYGVPRGELFEEGSARAEVRGLGQRTGTAQTGRRREYVAHDSEPDTGRPPKGGF